MRVSDIVARGHDIDVVKKVERLLFIAEYKRRQSAPGGEGDEKRNFGRDRRYPIVNRFRDEGKRLPRRTLPLHRRRSSAELSGLRSRLQQKPEMTRMTIIGHFRSEAMDDVRKPARSARKVAKSRKGAGKKRWRKRNPLDSVAEAKARFSEVIERAQAGEAQTITRNGGGKSRRSSLMISGGKSLSGKAPWPTF